ncbi:helix-turn-helix domain-containing protein [Paenibacillus sp. LjRoot153]|uniref:helix-turn-helix domain-containing protein n=1 Tax=Paenibacillus sp. LjRoot153 TaxID=3342270 RepID=UPI003ED0D937
MSEPKKSLEEYPEVLSADHIKEFLGIGRDQSYNLLKSGKFHVVQVGRRVFVDKEIFKKWLQGA